MKRIIYPLLFCLLHGAAGAAPKQESAGQQAFKKYQGVIRQLTEEKQALEAEKSALLEQVKKLEGAVRQLESLQGEVRLHKNQAEGLRNANGSLTAQLHGERDKQLNLQHKLKDIIAQAKLIQTDNRLLVAAVGEREQWIKQCAGKNRQLVESSQALVGKYRDKGFWDEVAELEPFTGIGNVETQNTVESYQFKLEDLKVTDFAGANNEQRQEANKTGEQPPPDDG